jgi:hypothetical protein
MRVATKRILTVNYEREQKRCQPPNLAKVEKISPGKLPRLPRFGGCHLFLLTFPPTRLERLVLSQLMRPFVVRLCGQRAFHRTESASRWRWADLP